MKTIKFLLVATLLLCLVGGAHAMRLEVNGNVVFATGRVEDDLGRFRAAFAQPGVDTVAFVNSPGGDLWTGLAVGRLIAARGLKTVAAGFCVSSCSIMFMGGKERSFSDAFRPAQTFIGIHGAHSVDTNSVVAQIQPQIWAFYKQNIKDNFNADVMNQALYDMNDAGALLRVFDAARSPTRVPFHCKSVQTLRKDCSEFKDQDALSLGIVTTNTLTPLDLPAAFKQSQSVMGMALTQLIADLPAYFKTISDKQCRTDACRSLITDFTSAKENNAFATAPGDIGWGLARNSDTAAQAFALAIYSCNHPKDKPARLCETQVLNNFDVSVFYTSAVARHAQAMATLVAPSSRFYANEEFGGGMTSANGLRTQRMQDITPQTIEGVKTYGTQDLAKALKSDHVPVLVDVRGGDEAIPSALTLLRGGLAFEDAAADKGFEARFAALLDLLSPDRTRALIFYCQSRDNWLAVNASLRAKQLGYTQVGWYRGGIDSWRAASLPMASAVVRAVVN